MKTIFIIPIITVYVLIMVTLWFFYLKYIFRTVKGNQREKEIALFKLLKFEFRWYFLRTVWWLPSPLREDDPKEKKEKLEAVARESKTLFYEYLLLALSIAGIGILAFFLGNRGRSASLILLLFVLPFSSLLPLHYYFISYLFTNTDWRSSEIISGAES